MIKKKCMGDNMRTFEISGNLDNPEEGLSNYQVFEKVILNIKEYYEKYLGQDFMRSLDLLVDNATENTGYVPIATPILGKYVIIKLGISAGDPEHRIAFQFAHELMHYAYFVKYGINKERAGEVEEGVCTAASLCVLKAMYPEELKGYVEYLKQEREEYRKGIEVAEKVEYEFGYLIQKIWGEDTCTSSNTELQNPVQ